MEALHAAGMKAEPREDEAAAGAQNGLLPLSPLAPHQAAAGVGPKAGDFAAGLAAVPELKVEPPEGKIHRVDPKFAS
jgi:hypothetical protein